MATLSLSDSSEDIRCSPAVAGAARLVSNRSMLYAYRLHLSFQSFVHLLPDIKNFEHMQNFFSFENYHLPLQFLTLFQFFIRPIQSW